jgi:hypothetical protein
VGDWTVAVTVITYITNFDECSLLYKVRGS